MVFAASASAEQTASQERKKVKITTEGLGAAVATVLKRSDLSVFPSGARWTGKYVIADQTPLPECASYRPKQSDLVLTGGYGYSWKTREGLALSSNSLVLGSPEMVRLDWKRTVRAPQAMACMQESIEKGFAACCTVISFKHLAFPKVGTYTAAFRAVVEQQTDQGSFRLITDVIWIGRGRTELALTGGAPAVVASAIRKYEVALARRLEARIRL